MENATLEASVANAKDECAVLRTECAECNAMYDEAESNCQSLKQELAAEKAAKEELEGQLKVCMLAVHEYRHCRRSERCCAPGWAS